MHTLYGRDGQCIRSCLFAGQRTALFLGPVPEDKLPKDGAPGRLLTGALTLAKLSGAAGNGDAPGAPQLTYVVRTRL